jgi:hypothetical protein
MSLQEKFQISAPPVKETDHEWLPHNAQIHKGEAGFQHSNNTYADTESVNKTNYLPPGMEINNQQRKRINPMPFSMAGATDVSNLVTAGGFDEGFTRQTMNGTDDQVSGEHMDHFYGEVEDELGNIGFIERNNYLDRN